MNTTQKTGINCWMTERTICGSIWPAGSSLSARFSPPSVVLSVFVRFFLRDEIMYSVGDSRIWITCWWLSSARSRALSSAVRPSSSRRSGFAPFDKRAINTCKQRD